jgi:hypothetical protein
MARLANRGLRGKSPLSRSTVLPRMRYLADSNRQKKPLAATFPGRAAEVHPKME